ncbi:hypothetical protein, partial [Caulobacter sp. S45]|uniref:hypothetical protein n=1 Tax=Caulobacter sp. S45 TaxID=1641861 RepID=UPI001C209321
NLASLIASAARLLGFGKAAGGRAADGGEAAVEGAGVGAAVFARDVVPPSLDDDPGEQAAKPTISKRAGDSLA